MGDEVFKVPCRRWKTWPVNLTGIGMALRIEDSRWFIFSIWWNCVTAQRAPAGLRCF